RGAPHDLHAKEPALRLQELARAEEVPGPELERAHDRALVEAPGADDGDLPVAGPRPRLDLEGHLRRPRALRRNERLPEDVGVRVAPVPQPRDERVARGVEGDRAQAAS